MISAHGRESNDASDAENDGTNLNKGNGGGVVLQFSYSRLSDGCHLSRMRRDPEVKPSGEKSASLPKRAKPGVSG